MQINNLQNLLELFFEQYKLQNKNEVFLQPLRIDQKSFTWEETFKSIIKLSEEIKKIVLVTIPSENFDFIKSVVTDLFQKSGFKKGFKVGTQEYKDCILNKGKKIND